MQFILYVVFLISFQIKEDITIDKIEAKKAFEYLNCLRVNTSMYCTEFPFLKISNIHNTELIWNDTLATVAESKAYDMASKKKLTHIDSKGYGINYLIEKSGYHLNPLWTKNKKANYFESIAAGAEDGESAINMLIIDNNTPSLAHRKHLLGMGAWYNELTDIGIGFAINEQDSIYETYFCIIIAKHK